MKYKTSASHNEMMIKRLRKDSNFCVEYLKAAIEDSEEPKVLLLVLRQIVEARGGIAKIAKAADITPESLNRALSARGSPRLSTVVAVAKAIGLKLTALR